MAPTLYPLLLLLLFAATSSAAYHATPPEEPKPAPWPERFHARMFTNLTNHSMASTGPPLRITDLYYDWPRRRNLNLVRHQLSPDPLYDMEWGSGTSFYFDSRSCRTERFPVGVLLPGWLADGEGAVYLGRQVTGGIECDVWDKLGFIVYYQDVATGRPVRWNFLVDGGDDKDEGEEEEQEIINVEDGLDAARLLRSCGVLLACANICEYSSG